MDEKRLAEIEAQAARRPGMLSGCTDYACECHFNVPELIAEIRRLQYDKEEHDVWFHQ